MYQNKIVLSKKAYKKANKRNILISLYYKNNKCYGKKRYRLEIPQFSLGKSESIKKGNILGKLEDNVCDYSKNKNRNH